MATRPKMSRVKILDKYKISLVNAIAYKELAEKMTEFGYDEKKVATGQALFDKAIELKDSCYSSHNRQHLAYLEFKKKWAALLKIYRVHRKLAKILYRTDSPTLDKLGLRGRMPVYKLTLRGTIRIFYNTALGDASIQKKFAEVNVQAEKLNDALDKVNDVADAWAAFILAKGIAQNETDKRNALYTKLDNWMSDFYIVARIATVEKPQMLEAFTVVVKG